MIYFVGTRLHQLSPMNEIYVLEEWHFSQNQNFLKALPDMTWGNGDLMNAKYMIAAM